MSLLQMSFSGAVMILAVTVIRALLVNKLPKRTFLALWGIVLARLLLPFSLPSMFSVYSLLWQGAPTMDTVRNAQIVRLLPIDPAGQMAVTSGSLSGAAADVSIWGMLWLLGMLACALLFAFAYWKCYQEFRTSTPVDSEFAQAWLSAHKLKRPVSIRQSDCFSAPLTYGVFHPVILMQKSARWTDTGVLQYILAHEYVHIRRFDSVTKLVMTAALCVHWFNPLAWVMYILANRDIELSCDEAVVRLFGEDTKASYARMLITMEETRGGLTPLCNNFCRNAIEERITAIMKTRKTTIFSLVSACFIVAGIAAAFATTTQDDGALSPEKQLFPSPDAEWWTYEEYEAWLENEKEQLQGMIGEKAWTGGRGEFVWTQEIVDETIATYEKTLQDIKNGMMVSKSVDGDTDIQTTYNSVFVDLYSSRKSMAISTRLPNGEKAVFVFGSYETAEELLSDAVAFCTEQIERGCMEQSEADEIIGIIQSKYNILKGL